MAGVESADRAFGALGRPLVAVQDGPAGRMHAAVSMLRTCVRGTDPAPVFGRLAQRTKVSLDGWRM